MLCLPTKHRDNLRSVNSRKRKFKQRPRALPPLKRKHNNFRLKPRALQKIACLQPSLRLRACDAASLQDVKPLVSNAPLHHRNKSRKPHGLFFQYLQQQSGWACCQLHVQVLIHSEPSRSLSQQPMPHTWQRKDCCCPCNRVRLELTH